MGLNSNPTPDSVSLAISKIHMTFTYDKNNHTTTEQETWQPTTMIWWIWLRFCFAVLIDSRISFQLAGPMSNFPTWGTWNVNALVQWELSLSVAFSRSLRPTYEPVFFFYFRVVPIRYFRGVETVLPR